MSADRSKAVEELLATARRVTRCRMEGRREEEEQLLEFMDSLWDRMPREERGEAEEALREAGLADFAQKIEKNRDELP